MFGIKKRQGDAHIVQNIIRYCYVPDIICGEFDDDLHSVSLTPSVVHIAYWPDYGMEPTKPVTL